MTYFRSTLRLLGLSILSQTILGFAVPHTTTRSSSLCLKSSKQDLSAQEALARTATHLQRLERQQQQQKAPVSAAGDNDPFANEREELYRSYMKQAANALKMELKRRGLAAAGRKPNLAARLAEYDLQERHGVQTTTQQDHSAQQVKEWKDGQERKRLTLPVKNFCGLPLSDTAGRALGSAEFTTPTAIQAQAIPVLAYGESAILHAETGSGKTLAYLLPFTEMLWEADEQQVLDADDSSGGGVGYGIILTPTRELAAQVAGIATVLAPPGTVRLISHATNLMSDGSKERGEGIYGGRVDADDNNDGSSRRSSSPKLFIGSAKSIMHSLYGDGVMPASPTTKPEAQYFLKNVRYVVLDEVDRLLHAKKSRGGNSPSGSKKSKVHEKPAAVVSAAVARMTLGRAQMVAASATVGRPLKRELARVLGLPAQSCPRVIRGQDEHKDDRLQKTASGGTSQSNFKSSRRAVSVPSTVRNYVVAVDGSSTGKLLTTAAFVLKQLGNKPRKILLVLTRACGMLTQNAMGALKHFGFQPISLLDALDTNGGGTNDMIEVHRLVSGATGVGESSSSPNPYFSSTSNKPTNHEMDKSGYLLVTGEDSVRGLHLDGLDVVLVVGRPHGPDEYTHIAGRTGRSGQKGSVVNVVSAENAAALSSWEHMLSLRFEKLESGDVAKL